MPECISEVGVFVAVLLAFYSDLMKWIQECQEAHLRFLLSFDMIFTSICELRPHAADFSQSVFVFIFINVFKISMKFICFLRPFFLATRATFGEIPAMRRCEQRCVRCVRDSMALLLRSGLCDAKLRCASRDLRCAMRDRYDAHGCRSQHH